MSAEPKSQGVAGWTLSSSARIEAAARYRQIASGRWMSQKDIFIPLSEQDDFSVKVRCDIKYIVPLCTISVNNKDSSIRDDRAILERYNSLLFPIIYGWAWRIFYQKLSQLGLQGVDCGGDAPRHS